MKQNKENISRREFLRGLGALAIAGTVSYNNRATAQNLPVYPEVKEGINQKINERRESIIKSAKELEVRAIEEFNTAIEDQKFTKTERYRIYDLLSKSKGLFDSLGDSSYKELALQDAQTLYQGLNTRLYRPHLSKCSFNEDLEKLGVKVGMDELRLVSSIFSGAISVLGLIGAAYGIQYGLHKYSKKKEDSRES